MSLHGVSTVCLDDIHLPPAARRKRVETALALRQCGVFASVDVYERMMPSTAGAELNTPTEADYVVGWASTSMAGIQGPHRGDRR